MARGVDVRYHALGGAGTLGCAVVVEAHTAALAVDLVGDGQARRVVVGPASVDVQDIARAAPWLVGHARGDEVVLGHRRIGGHALGEVGGTAGLARAVAHDVPAQELIAVVVGRQLVGDGVEGRIVLGHHRHRIERAAHAGDRLDAVVSVTATHGHGAHTVGVHRLGDLAAGRGAAHLGIGDVVNLGQALVAPHGKELDGGVGRRRHHEGIVRRVTVRHIEGGGIIRHGLVLSPAEKDVSGLRNVGPNDACGRLGLAVGQVNLLVGLDQERPVRVGVLDSPVVVEGHARLGRTGVGGIGHRHVGRDLPLGPRAALGVENELDGLGHPERREVPAMVAHVCRQLVIARQPSAVLIDGATVGRGRLTTRIHTVLIPLPAMEEPTGAAHISRGHGIGAVVAGEHGRVGSILTVAEIEVFRTVAIERVGDIIAGKRPAAIVEGIPDCQGIRDVSGSRASPYDRIEGGLAWRLPLELAVVTMLARQPQNLVHILHAPAGVEGGIALDLHGERRRVAAQARLDGVASRIGDDIAPALCDDRIVVVGILVIARHEMVVGITGRSMACGDAIHADGLTGTIGRFIGVRVNNHQARRDRIIVVVLGVEDVTVELVLEGGARGLVRIPEGDGPLRALPGRLEDHVLVRHHKGALGVFVVGPLDRDVGRRPRPEDPAFGQARRLVHGIRRAVGGIPAAVGGVGVGRLHGAVGGDDLVAIRVLIDDLVLVALVEELERQCAETRLWIHFDDALVGGFGLVGAVGEALVGQRRALHLGEIGARGRLDVLVVALVGELVVGLLQPVLHRVGDALVGPEVGDIRGLDIQLALTVAEVLLAVLVQLGTLVGTEPRLLVPLGGVVGIGLIGPAEELVARARVGDGANDVLLVARRGSDVLAVAGDPAVLEVVRLVGHGHVVVLGEDGRVLHGLVGAAIGLRHEAGLLAHHVAVAVNPVDEVVAQGRHSHRTRDGGVGNLLVVLIKLLAADGAHLLGLDRHPVVGTGVRGDVGDHDGQLDVVSVEGHVMPRQVVRVAQAHQALALGRERPAVPLIAVLGHAGTRHRDGRQAAAGDILQDAILGLTAVGIEVHGAVEGQPLRGERVVAVELGREVDGIGACGTAVQFVVLGTQPAGEDEIVGGVGERPLGEPRGLDAQVALVIEVAGPVGALILVGVHGGALGAASEAAVVALLVHHRVQADPVGREGGGSLDLDGGHVGRGVELVALQHVALVGDHLIGPAVEAGMAGGKADVFRGAPADDGGTAVGHLLLDQIGGTRHLARLAVVVMRAHERHLVGRGHPHGVERLVGGGRAVDGGVLVVHVERRAGVDETVAVGIGPGLTRPAPAHEGEAIHRVAVAHELGLALVAHGLAGHGVGVEHGLGDGGARAVDPGHIGIEGHRVDGLLPLCDQGAPIVGHVEVVQLAGLIDGAGLLVLPAHEHPVVRILDGLAVAHDLHGLGLGTIPGVEGTLEGIFAHLVDRVGVRVDGRALGVLVPIALGAGAVPHRACLLPDGDQGRGPVDLQGGVVVVQREVRCAAVLGDLGGAGDLGKVEAHLAGLGQAVIGHGVSPAVQVVTLLGHDHRVVVLGQVAEGHDLGTVGHGHRAHIGLGRLAVVAHVAVLPHPQGVELHHVALLGSEVEDRLTVNEVLFLRVGGEGPALEEVVLERELVVGQVERLVVGDHLGRHVACHLVLRADVVLLELNLVGNGRPVGIQVEGTIGHCGDTAELVEARRHGRRVGEARVLVRLVHPAREGVARTGEALLGELHRVAGTVGLARDLALHAVGVRMVDHVVYLFAPLGEEGDLGVVFVGQVLDQLPIVVMGTRAVALGVPAGEEVAREGHRGVLGQTLGHVVDEGLVRQEPDAAVGVETHVIEIGLEVCIEDQVGGPSLHGRLGRLVEEVGGDGLAVLVRPVHQVVAGHIACIALSGDLVAASLVLGDHDLLGQRVLETTLANHHVGDGDRDGLPQDVQGDICRRRHVGHIDVLEPRQGDTHVAEGGRIGHQDVRALLVLVVTVHIQEPAAEHEAVSRGIGGGQQMVGIPRHIGLGIDVRRQGLAVIALLVLAGGVVVLDVVVNLIDVGFPPGVEGDGLARHGQRGVEYVAVHGLHLICEGVEPLGRHIGVDALVILVVHVDTLVGVRLIRIREGRPTGELIAIAAHGTALGHAHAELAARTHAVVDELKHGLLAILVGADDQRRVVGALQAHARVVGAGPEAALGGEVEEALLVGG